MGRNRRGPSDTAARYRRVTLGATAAILGAMRRPAALTAPGASAGPGDGLLQPIPVAGVFVLLLNDHGWGGLRGCRKAL